MTSENSLFTLIVMCLLWWLLYHHSLCEDYEIGVGSRRRPWQMRPRTPKDCPQCQCEHPHVHAPQEITPWSQVTSRRGRPKELDSEGQ
jgi:hypothetical protein